MMKNSAKIWLYIFGFSLLGLCFCAAQEEKISITTYYPSPYGSYKELNSETFNFTPKDYGTNNVNRPACDTSHPSMEGTVYYDKNSKLIYFCDGIQWKELGSSGEGDGTIIKIAGFAGISYTAPTESGGDFNIIPAYANYTDYCLQGSLCEQYWGALGFYGRVYNCPHCLRGGACIDMRNFSKGAYSEEWGATITMDQYAEVSAVYQGVKGARGKYAYTTQVTAGTDEYNQVVEIFQEHMPIYVKDAWLRLVYGSAVTCDQYRIDQSDYYYDTNDPVRKGVSTVFNLNRVRNTTYRRFPVGTPAPRYYFVILNKNDSDNKDSSLIVDLDYYDAGEGKYKVIYRNKLDVRLTNVNFLLSREK